MQQIIATMNETHSTLNPVNFVIYQIRSLTS